MRISAPNVNLAQQQAARPQRPALQPEPFEPLDFKQAQMPAETAAQAPEPRTYVRPGSQIDIKV